MALDPRRYNGGGPIAGVIIEGTVDAAGTVTPSPTGGGVLLVQPALAAGTNKSGTATTTSGGLSVVANAARKSLVGQNVSSVTIGFNEFGGTAAIGTSGTYTVAAGGSFSVSTSGLVNFIAASGTAAVTMTEV